VPSRKIVVVRNGIDVDAFPLASRRPTPRRVVVVANLRPEKGHDVLIRAAPYVLDRFPDASFDIVGGGPLSGELRAMASQAGVARSFTFAGHRDDVAARLAAADLFVLPSRSESSPNGVLEAMASGLPVVASAVGGVGEMIADRRTGLLAPADDPLALADCICRIMASPALAAALGDAARADVVSRYSFDAMIAAFDTLYQAELRRRCPRMIEGSQAAAAA
jgi:glycosyltransferase involved in cell wall biosynthesis